MIHTLSDLYDGIDEHRIEMEKNHWNEDENEAEAEGENAKENGNERTNEIRNENMVD